MCLYREENDSEKMPRNHKNRTMRLALLLAPHHDALPCFSFPGVKPVDVLLLVLLESWLVVVRRPQPRPNSLACCGSSRAFPPASPRSDGSGHIGLPK